jgi:hypothetical protein
MKEKTPWSNHHLQVNQRMETVAAVAVADAAVGVVDVLNAAEVVALEVAAGVTQVVGKVAAVRGQLEETGK